MVVPSCGSLGMTGISPDDDDDVRVEKQTAFWVCFAGLLITLAVLMAHVASRELENNAWDYYFPLVNYVLWIVIGMVVGCHELVFVFA